MRYQKPEVIATVFALSLIQQRQGHVPTKWGGPYLDLVTEQFDSDISTAAAYEADE